jgi:hypothetical protein
LLQASGGAEQTIVLVGRARLRALVSRQLDDCTALVSEQRVTSAKSELALQSTNLTIAERDEAIRVLQQESNSALSCAIVTFALAVTALEHVVFETKHANYAAKQRVLARNQVAR